MHTAPPPISTQLRLAHACLEHLAAMSSARILHIKGVALDARLARDRPASTDCDVLVHPDDVPAYSAALAEHGWEQRTRFEHGSIFGHAATFYSPVWGTVDLHRSFPGLDRDPVATFEELWRDRRTVRLGGSDCAVPDLPGQRLILLVHAARSSGEHGAGDEASAWGRADADERRQIDDMAARLGARVPLAIATGRPELADGMPDARTWRAVRAGADSTEIWRARLADARREPVRFARVLASALRVNPDHLAIRLGREPTAEDMRRERRERWRRGLRRLLPFVRRPGRRG